MKIKKTRYIAVVNTENGIIKVPLFDKESGEGISGEGKAFAQARALLKSYGLQGRPFNVQKVEITANIDTKAAAKAGCLSAWEIAE